MSLGPGKYDADCTAIRERTKAEGVILVVLSDDPARSGFSAQATLPMLVRIPHMLRSMADQIEADQKGGQL
jgi:hypothetical protein